MFVSGLGRYEQAKRFQKRSLKKNDKPEKKITYIGHVFNGLGRNEESL
jgi:hypothetical protein